MKEAYNLQGELVKVTIDTPTKYKDGVRRLLTEKELIALEAKNTAWEADSVKRNALVEIARLEAQITPRRMREAVLGTDDGWLANQESLIATERARLNA